LQETNWSYGLTTAWVGRENTYSLTGGLSEGFQDYRSVWLAEFYRQGFEQDPVYSQPDPSSTYFGGEWARLLLKEQLRLSLSANYRKDRIAPPYERVIPTNPLQMIFTEVGLEELQTRSFGFDADWITSQRTRIQLSSSTDDTTDRELRWSNELKLYYALSQSWVASLTGTHVSEGSDFKAWSVAGALDYDIYESWFFSLSARYYEDDGLVLDPSLVSGDSPPLDRWQLGLRVAKVFERASISCAAFYYRSTYDPLGPNSFEYENLYQDRSWLQLRLACSLSF
jgi:hypothetical protein